MRWELFRILPYEDICITFNTTGDGNRDLLGVSMKQRFLLTWVNQRVDLD
jgi:hypothetical protein